MTRISIIMPVYNCEEYLKESIDSVLKQTMQEWELLCVDDGSTDRSADILREYAKKDSRIHVFTQQNQGAGPARNLGLQNAQGEFVSFLDADDFYLDVDTLECMYCTCKEKNVKSCGTNLQILRNGEIVPDIIFGDIGQAAFKGEILDYTDFQFDYGYYCFIFERQILIQRGICFPPYRRFQDPPFFIRAMHEIGKFCFIDKSLYCYRMPNVSRRFSNVKLEGLLKGLYDNLEFAKENGLSILFHRTIKRLEDEYSEIICHNIADVENLQLLLKMNEIIRNTACADYEMSSAKMHSGYIIKPLQKILNSVAEAEKYRKKDFEYSLIQSDRIFVYGAGKRTADFLVYLQHKNIFHKAAGILVTDTENNAKQVEGIDVKAIEEYQYRDGDIVVIAVSGMYQDEIVTQLETMGVARYERLHMGIFDE